jgi:GNAT superfamily N-acetyltransferase
VYIAVDNSHRGKGYGKQLMEKAIPIAEGNIASKPDNPAKNYTKNWDLLTNT